MHLNNILEHKLDRNSVCKKFLHTAEYDFNKEPPPNGFQKSVKKSLNSEFTRQSKLLLQRLFLFTNFENTILLVTHRYGFFLSLYNIIRR